MSNKLIVIGSFVCFVVFLFSVWFVLTYPGEFHELNRKESTEESLSFSNYPNIVCSLSRLHSPEAAPSLKSFVKASTTEENRDLTFNGLAIVSKLANACQPLVDVRRARVQVNKIALIAIKKDLATTCSLCGSKSAARWILYGDIVFPSMDVRGKL